MFPKKILFAAMPLALLVGAAAAEARDTQQRPSAQSARPHAAELQPGATVLIVQDEAPWGTTSNQELLTQFGVAYDTIGSARFDRIDLAQYTAIIVASVQPDAFYERLGRHAERIRKWLRWGPHTLEFHAARYSFSAPLNFDLPLGVQIRHSLQEINVLSGIESPLVFNLPATMTGNLASHSYFVRHDPVAESVLITTLDGWPTMLDYCVGLGRVIATGQTVEFGYDVSWDFAPALPNMIAASALSPGCPAGAAFKAPGRTR